MINIYYYFDECKIYYSLKLFFDVLLFAQSERKKLFDLFLDAP